MFIDPLKGSVGSRGMVGEKGIQDLVNTLPEFSVSVLTFQPTIPINT